MLLEPHQQLDAIITRKATDEAIPMLLTDAAKSGSLEGDGTMKEEGPEGLRESHASIAGYSCVPAALGSPAARAS